MSNMYKSCMERTLPEGTMSEWVMSQLVTQKKNVLMTLEHLNKHQSLGDQEGYCSEELDDVKDCMCILHKIYEIKKHMTS